MPGRGIGVKASKYFSIWSPTVCVVHNSQYGHQRLPVIHRYNFLRPNILLITIYEVFISISKVLFNCVEVSGLQAAY